MPAPHGAAHDHLGHGRYLVTCTILMPDADWDDASEVTAW